MPQTQRLTGLVAATHTPFHTDGSLNLSIVEKQAAHLLANGVRNAFIGGSTGESHSLSLEERRALAQRWFEVIRGSQLKVVVHVGSNCLADAATLAGGDGGEEVGWIAEGFEVEELGFDGGVAALDVGVGVGRAGGLKWWVAPTPVRAP